MSWFEDGETKPTGKMEEEKEDEDSDAKEDEDDDKEDEDEDKEDDDEENVHSEEHLFSDFSDYSETRRTTPLFIENIDEIRCCKHVWILEVMD